MYCSSEEPIRFTVNISSLRLHGIIGVVGIAASADAAEAVTVMGIIAKQLSFAVAPAMSALCT
jgi:L-serine deaminase